MSSRALIADAEQGRAIRSEVPRSAAADWRPAGGREDPVKVLGLQDAARIPALVPVRHARMSVSPFTFYRGAAALMAADLASLPVTDLTVQLCGDAHLCNFGAFASPGRYLLFDLNDFDETLRGPWEWDVHRLVTSFTIAARANGFPKSKIEGCAAAAVQRYRRSMREFAALPPLEVWYSRLDTADLRRSLERNRRTGVREFDRGVESARRRTSLQAAQKLTEHVDGRLRFRADPPVLVPLGTVAAGMAAQHLGDAVRSAYEGYVATLSDDRQLLLSRYSVVDVAHKVVGVGSVGLRAFIVLLQSASGDPLILQFKEATASVLEEHLGSSPYEHHGRRVVEGQHLMQAASDIFLGWSSSSIDGRDYYWRQLRDMKGSAVVEAMGPRALNWYAAMCGWSLARAHARSGPVRAIAGYLGKRDAFDRAALDFAARYADLNEADYARHQQAINDGELASDPTI